MDWLVRSFIHHSYVGVQTSRSWSKVPVVLWNSAPTEFYYGLFQLSTAGLSIADLQTNFALAQYFGAEYRIAGTKLVQHFSNTC